MLIVVYKNIIYENVFPNFANLPHPNILLIFIQQ